MSETRGKRKWFGAVVTVVALVAVGVHVALPGLRVDTVTFLFIVVALLPWLGQLLESVELPGGFKFRYQKLEEQIKQAEQTTAKADARAAEAASTAQAAFGAVGVVGAAQRATMETVRLLAEDYSRLYTGHSPGRGRSAELDRLFGVMAATVPNVADFDPATALRDHDGGMRLAGYAFLYSNPDPALADELVQALVKEQTRGSQYWGIRAVAAVIGQGDFSALSANAMAELRELKEELPTGTQRRTALEALLQAHREALLNPVQPGSQ